MKTTEAFLSLFKAGEKVHGRKTTVCWWLLISTLTVRPQYINQTGLVSGQNLTVAYFSSFTFQNYAFTWVPPFVFFLLQFINERLQVLQPWAIISPDATGGWRLSSGVLAWPTHQDFLSGKEHFSNSRINAWLVSCPSKSLKNRNKPEEIREKSRGLCVVLSLQNSMFCFFFLGFRTQLHRWAQACHHYFCPQENHSNPLPVLVGEPDDLNLLTLEAFPPLR